AYLLWDRRWTALALGMAWPAGYFLGRPAGWYSLSMLEGAGLAWCYILWRTTGRVAHLAALTLCAVLLVYTNYFGWGFLMVLSLDLWLSRPVRRLKDLLIAAGVVVLAFFPLIPDLLGRISTDVSTRGFGPAAIARAAYLAHSLLASELAAPWTWPGVVAVAC